MEWICLSLPVIVTICVVPISVSGFELDFTHFLWIVWASRSSQTLAGQSCWKRLISFFVLFVVPFTNGDYKSLLVSSGMASPLSRDHIYLEFVKKCPVPFLSRIGRIHFPLWLDAATLCSSSQFSWSFCMFCLFTGLPACKFHHPIYGWGRYQC